MKARIIILGLVLLTIVYALFVFKNPVDTNLQTRMRKARVEIDYINRGGCGYNAKYVKQYLDSIHIDSKVLLIDSPFIHVMVEADGTYIDKNGFFSNWHPITWFKKYPITLDSLQKLINDSVLWNNRFNKADTLRLRRILLNK